MAKKSEGVLDKISGALSALGGAKPVEGKFSLLLDAAADTAALITALLEGEGAVVAERLARAEFPLPEGAAVNDHEGKVLAFLDTAATVETAGLNRPVVHEAITARGLGILEPSAPETRPAPPPVGDTAPPPDGGAQAPPEVHRPPAPETRSLADDDGLVALVVLREDGLQGAGSAFVARGQRGRFSADEAYAHLTAGNARLPTPED